MHSKSWTGKEGVERGEGGGGGEGGEGGGNKEEGGGRSERGRKEEGGGMRERGGRRERGAKRRGVVIWGVSSDTGSWHGCTGRPGGVAVDVAHRPLLVFDDIVEHLNVEVDGQKQRRPNCSRGQTDGQAGVSIR